MNRPITFEIRDDDCSEIEKPAGEVAFGFSSTNFWHDATVNMGIDTLWLPILMPTDKAGWMRVTSR